MQRAVDGVDAVVHLGAVPNEAPFEEIAGPEPARRLPRLRGLPARRACSGSSSRAPTTRPGMYPVGVPLDGSERAAARTASTARRRPTARRSGSMFVDRFGLSVVCLRIGSFQPTPRETRELSTWLSHADGDPAGAGRADRRRRRLRDRLRRVGQHAPLVAAGRRDRLRARRTTPRSTRTSSTARTTRARAARTRRPTTAAGRRERRTPCARASTRRTRSAIGIEEELFLLDAETLDLLPQRARGGRARPSGDPRFKLELPAAQLEIVTPPCPDVASAVASLAAARRDLAARRRAVRPADDRRRAPVHRRARRADRRPALRAHAATSTASAPAASSSPACTCTSRWAAPTARSRSTTRCARTCPSWPRWPPTRRSTPAATPGWPRSARRSRSTCSARASRPRSRAGSGSRTALTLGRALGHGARTRAAGGSSCACTPPTARSSCACPTPSPASTTCTASPRSRYGLIH